MTYSHDQTLSSDLALVRFHIGDTSEDGAYLSDETITALLTLEGTVGKTVIACIKYIITQLSSPDFKMDWLSVSNKQAIEGYKYLLKTKAQELGVNVGGATASSSISLPYRADSYQDSDDSTYDGTP